MEKKAESLPIKTPKNLTNNKLDSEEDLGEKMDQKDIDDIDDETINPGNENTYDDGIEDFYDNE